MAVASDILGDKLLKIDFQFATSRYADDLEAARVAALPVIDPRGRKRFFQPPSMRMIPHNDGFAFGDFGPDYLFLWCQRPANAGGDSTVIDGAKLVKLLEDDGSTADLARFCWEVDIDLSDPSNLAANEGPIARRLASGRVQVHNHPHILAKAGANEALEGPMVRRWQEAVISARDSGPTFRIEAGEMLCIDNYRMLHGRDAFDDEARMVHAMWAWTTDALAVPSGSVDVHDPTVPTAH
ncbi:MAG TPA: TauD/TfdA family dioxygenase [Acidimicrobiales bacterium]|nr:TauD/TfdA family dioxygenase [Acidimicrobiales bacterium]